MLADELREVARGLSIEKVGQVKAPFTLWWQPELDEGRKKHIQFLDVLKRAMVGKAVLEVGYPWGGRVFLGSKVLDLYDPRPGIDYRIDACDMKGVADDSFDLVLSCSVLEHIPRFWLAAAEIERVLKPGGLVWIGVPSVWPYHPGGEFQGQGYDYGGDYWRMNHAALEVLFGRCKRITCWYVPASPQAGDDPRSGWGVTWVGEKVR
jgi:SAM-dependent methyltransferase